MHENNKIRGKCAVTPHRRQNNGALRKSYVDTGGSLFLHACLDTRLSTLLLEGV